MPRGELRVAKTVGVAAMVTTLVLIASSGLALVAVGISNRLGDEPEDAAPALVYGEVTRDPIVDEVVGKVVIGASRYIAITASGTATRDGLAANVPVDAEGTVIATVDERPVLVMLGAVPAYRSIGPGSEGADVSQLQGALKRAGQVVKDKDGHYGDSTARAFYEYLRDNKIAPMSASGDTIRSDAWKSTGIPKDQIVFAPSFPVTSATPCGVAGNSVAGELCVLASGTATTVFEVPRVDASRLEAGMHVELQFGTGTTLSATLGDISTPLIEVSPDSDEPGASDEDTTVRFNVVVDTPEHLVAGMEGSGRVTLAQSAPDTFRVEGAAIRDRESGQPTLRLADGTETIVELDICTGGYCSVRSDNLVANTDVIIAGELDEN